MKLRHINENLLAHKLREGLNSSGYFNRPIQQIQPYDSSTGTDSGARSSGYSNLLTGIPNKQRHRHFLGFEKRLGTIRL